MNTQMKDRLTSSDVWLRALYMIFFAIAYSVAELIVALLVVFQLLAVLFTGSVNEPLLRFGRNLGEYVFQILQFETFNSEEKPFPFSDWPDAAPGGESWLESSMPDPDTRADAEADSAAGQVDEDSSASFDAAPDAEVSESRKDATPPSA